MIIAAEILTHAADLIEKFGWQRDVWSRDFGPVPRCTRAAIFWAAREHDCLARPPHHDALRLVSEAIYGPKHVGGINDWEYRKRTTKEDVVCVLRKAAALAEARANLTQPDPKHRLPHCGLWPT